MGDMLATAKLGRQSYGIAVAGGCFGGPRGIWLECTKCDESQFVIGSAGVTGGKYDADDWARVPNSDVAKVFRRHGWTGNGPNMLKAKCPACSKALGETK